MKEIIALILILLPLHASADTFKAIKDTPVRYAAGQEYESFFTLLLGDAVNGEARDGWAEIDCYGFKGFSETENFVKLDLLGNYYVTGYDTCARCCGKSDGITASGKLAEVGRTVAMSLPFGTEIYIDGIGYRTVEDRGVSGARVDVLCANHAACYAITGTRGVYLVKSRKE